MKARPLKYSDRPNSNESKPKLVITEFTGTYNYFIQVISPEEIDEQTLNQFIEDKPGYSYRKVAEVNGAHIYNMGLDLGRKFREYAKKSGKYDVIEEYYAL